MVLPFVSRNWSAALAMLGRQRISPKRIPRPMAIAMANRPVEMPAAPAAARKILNGIGGGSSDGMSTAISRTRLEGAERPFHAFRAEALRDERIALASTQYGIRQPTPGPPWRSPRARHARLVRVTIHTSRIDDLRQRMNEGKAAAARNNPSAPRASAAVCTSRRSLLAGEQVV